MPEHTKWILVPLLALGFALIPSLAFADAGKNDGGLLLRINGDVTLPQGETVAAVIVINGNAVIEGTVKNTVLVIDGNALVRGTIEEGLTVISGDIDLQSGSRVKNVNSVRGNLVKAQGATVTGSVHERENFGVARGVIAVFSVLFWLGMTVAVIVAGLIFAAVGGRQLTVAARTMTGDAVNTILGAVFLWVGVPIAALVAVFTLIGLPLGIGLLIFLMPTLWFLGYIVAGARLGGFVAGLAGRDAGTHPYFATFIGLLLLQLGVFVPVIGAAVAFLAGIWGGGALAYIAFRAAGGKGFTPTGADSGTQPLPASQ